MTEIRGRWALVTGASSGFGAEFARDLSARGANVVLVARREEPMKALAAEIERAHGVATRVVAMDLAQPDAPARLRDALGTALPPGLPQAVLEPLPDPLTDLVRRHARTHGPFEPADLAARLGLPVGVHRVFEIDAHQIGAGRHGLGEALGLFSGDEKHRTGDRVLTVHTDN